MSTSYKIHKVVGNVSSRRARSQVTVLFNDKPVTRHLVNGMGRHPDDKMPGRHGLAEQRIHTLKESLKTMGPKIDQGEALLMNPTADPKAKRIIAMGLPSWRAYVARLPFEIREAECALETLRDNDPLMVRYTL